MKKLINLLASAVLTAATFSPLMAGNPDSTIIDSEPVKDRIELAQAPIEVGPQEFQDPLGVREASFLNPDQMKVYPNPSSQLDLRMELPVAPTQIMHVFLYDSEGKMIYAKRGHYEEFERLVIQNAPAGFYILRAFTPDQAFQSRITITP